MRGHEFELQRITHVTSLSFLDDDVVSDVDVDRGRNLGVVGVLDAVVRPQGLVEAVSYYRNVVRDLK